METNQARRTLPPSGRIYPAEIMAAAHALHVGVTALQYANRTNWLPPNAAQREALVKARYYDPLAAMPCCCCPQTILLLHESPELLVPLVSDLRYKNPCISGTKEACGVNFESENWLAKKVKGWALLTYGHPYGVVFRSTFDNKVDAEVYAAFMLKYNGDIEAIEQVYLSKASTPRNLRMYEALLDGSRCRYELITRPLELTGPIYAGYDAPPTQETP